MPLQSVVACCTCSCKTLFEQWRNGERCWESLRITTIKAHHGSMQLPLPVGLKKPPNQSLTNPRSELVTNGNEELDEYFAIPHLALS
eukprot:3854033-Amphidinium_carterae.1